MKEKCYLFTSEVVSPGHPDKCADIIADSIVDKFLTNDPNARVASEVFLAGKNVIIGGEVKSSFKMSHQDYEDLVKQTLIKIGYFDNPAFSRDECLHPQDVEVQVLLNEQSDEINEGVDQSSGETGAGDQGIMFGFASIGDKKTLMPLALSCARKLSDCIYDYAKDHPQTLGVDIKTQVTIDYGSKEGFENCEAKRIHTVVVAVPCVRSMDINSLRELIRGLINKAGLPKELLDEKTLFHINGTGSYVKHSSLWDSGLTGRKLIVDSFGGYAPIGGGAQSSKDYTKVDRSGLYAARWIAKNIVAATLAKKCIVQLSYVIGEAKPISVCVDCMGTNQRGVDDDALSAFVHERYELTPDWIKKKFGLDRPSKDTFLYAKVAARGQVGQDYYPWEKLDGVEDLKAEFKL